MTKTFYENPDISKVLAMYEEYRQFVITATNDLQELAEHYQKLNESFVKRYEKNMQEYLEKINTDETA